MSKPVNLESFQNALKADLHLAFDPEVEIAGKWEVLSRFKKSGFSFVAITIAGHNDTIEMVIPYLARHRQYVLNNPDEFILVKNANDILRAKNENKLAISFWFQGSAALGNDINLLEIYHLLDIRSILLCYNTRNSIGDGCTEPKDAGLSEYGIQVVNEMNRLGMLIDCSHGGYNTTMEITELSKDPVIFSHSCAYGVHAHPRNLRDEQIKACAKKGGLIGVNSPNWFLGAESTPEKLVEHIDYMVQLVGSEHVGIGLEYIFFQERLDLYFQKKSGNFMQSYTQGKSKPSHISTLKPEQINDVIEMLIRKNYREIDIKNILGENLLRIAKRVWK